MTIWFEVEDLIWFFQNAPRPTGIQRLSFETYRAIWRKAGAGGEVRFCRRGASGSGFRAVHFPALEAGILAASAHSLAPANRPAAPPRPSKLFAAARLLPPQFRQPLGAMARAGHQVLIAARDLTRACLAPWRGRPSHTNRIGGHQFDLDGPDIAFTSGDWLVALGASWGHAYAPEHLASLRAGGMRLALLAHDLIPELFPEWCTQTMVTDFDRWLRDIVPQTDRMFAVSNNTATDLIACLKKRGTDIPPPVVLPVGSLAAPPPPSAQKPLAHPYVLMVGTIEARKNHAGMMRVWRRLLQTLPEDSIPDLVFAGKIGWLTTDLIQQLHNAGWLGGKLRFIDSPSEAQLANLYRHCLFTVFPSLYEGWGLPVTESLSAGKTVAASNRAAIPEAGGHFCAYFDPENINEAYEVIHGLIEHPGRIAAREARIAAQFHPPSWDDTAAALLTALGLEDPGILPQAQGLQSIH